VRGLALLARAGAALPWVVPQPPGALQANRRRLRHTRSRARHLAAALLRRPRRLGVERRRPARRPRAGGPIHGRSGPCDSTGSSPDHHSPRRRAPLVGRRVGGLEPARGVAATSSRFASGRSTAAFTPEGRCVWWTTPRRE